MEQFLNYIHVRLTPMEFLRACCAGTAALLTYAFGGADRWLVLLAVAIVSDYVSGVIAAIIHKELSSKRGLAGILKKMLLFCVVAVANVVDIATNANGVLRSLSIGFMIANEGISVLENAARCGIRVPKTLISALRQLREDENKNDNDSDDKKEG